MDWEDNRKTIMGPYLQSVAEPAGLCENSRGGTRTPDPTVNSRLLYQLSYSGLCCSSLITVVRGFKQTHEGWQERLDAR